MAAVSARDNGGTYALPNVVREPHFGVEGDERNAHRSHRPKFNELDTSMLTGNAA
jgi:hypothetical protein